VRNVVVGIQMLTMIALTIMFFRAGSPRLAIAQICYVIATGFLFIGVKV
jgi:hypothetical protein